MPDDCYIDVPSDGSNIVDSYRELLRRMVDGWEIPR
jgi:hypothetical protein